MKQLISKVVLLLAPAMFLGNLPAFADESVAPEKPVTEQLVDTLTQLSKGPHKGFRSNHAKGTMAEGSFVPSPQAESLSKAAHLQGTASPVLVRFSNATGVPTIADADGNAMPKGMAIRFTLPDGGSTDIVALSVNSFPTATPEEFLALLNAVAESGPDVPSPKPIETFLATHPAAMKFVSTPKPVPVSFANQPFFGVNAFAFTNAQGKTRYGRYRIMPVSGEKYLTEAEASKQVPDFLMTELPARLGKEEAKYRILVQLAKPGDPTNDPTVVWPEDREQIELGVLTLKSALKDGLQAEKTIMFNPLALPEGIAPSTDPILLARPGAYAVSFGRRFR